MIPSYSGKTAYTLSPDSVGTFAPTAGWRAVLLSVSVQACYMTLDGTTPTSTNGVTLPAGTVITIPTKHAPTVISAIAGSIVNAIFLY